MIRFDSWQWRTNSENSLKCQKHTLWIFALRNILFKFSHLEKWNSQMNFLIWEIIV